MNTEKNYRHNPDLIHQLKTSGLKIDENEKLYFDEEFRQFEIWADGEKDCYIKPISFFKNILKNVWYGRDEWELRN